MSEWADRPLRVPDEAVLLHVWRLFRWFLNVRLIPRWYEHKARLVMRLYRRFYHDGLTRTGKIVLVCSALVFLFSYRSSTGFLLSASALGVALVFWSIVLGFVLRPRVTVARETPATAVAGTSFVSTITVDNRSPRALYNYSVREMVVPDSRWPSEWSQPHEVALPAGQRARVAVDFEPRKRGIVTLSGLVVTSYFPFFLNRFTVRLDAAQDVYVLPPTLKVSLPSLRYVAEQASKRLALGTDNSRKGPSLEYAYSRPYQTGDSLRRLDQRASSRLGKPMSKVFEGTEEIRRDQVYLIVDLTLENFERWQRRPVNGAALDERLALAVELGLSAQNEGFSLAAFATGKEWHGVPGMLDFYRLVATSEAERAGTSRGASLPTSVLADNGLHVLVLGRWSSDAERLVDRWQRAGILVLVFLIPETPRDAGTLPVGKQYVEVQSERVQR